MKTRLILDEVDCRIHLHHDTLDDAFDTGGRHVRVLRENCTGFIGESVKPVRLEPLEAGQKLQLPVRTESSSKRFCNICIVAG